MAFRDDWSEKELRELKSALNILSIENITEIQKHVQTKSITQIEDLIKKCRMYNNREKLPSIEAPIESWIELTARLVYHDDIDHSENLSRAMTLIGEYEERTSTDLDLKVNYRLIYKYLAEILQGVETLMTLPPLECCVVLDLMHSLTVELQTKNTDVHQMVMNWKYKLLTSKIDLYKKHLQADSFKKALMNDFADLLNPEKKCTSPNQENTCESSPGCNVTQMSNNDASKSSPQVDMDQQSSEIQSSEKQSSKKKTLTERQNKLLHSVKNKTKCRRLVKPKLFTINPLCIPVALVKLKELNSSE